MFKRKLSNHEKDQSLMSLSLKRKMENIRNLIDDSHYKRKSDHTSSLRDNGTNFPGSSRDYTALSRSSSYSGTTDNRTTSSSRFSCSSGPRRIVIYNNNCKEEVNRNRDMSTASSKDAVDSRNSHDQERQQSQGSRPSRHNANAKSSTDSAHGARRRRLDNIESRKKDDTKNARHYREKVDWEDVTVLECLQSASTSFKFMPRTTTSKVYHELRRLRCSRDCRREEVRSWLQNANQGYDHSRRFAARTRKLSECDHAEGTQAKIDRKITFASQNTTFIFHSDSPIN